MEKIQTELSDLQKRMTDNESKWTELSDMVIAKLESISDQLFQRYKKQSDESCKELSLKINLVEKEASSFKKQTVSHQLETKKACKTIEKDIDDLKKKFKEADEKRAVFYLKVKAMDKLIQGNKKEISSLKMSASNSKANNNNAKVNSVSANYGSDCMTSNSNANINSNANSTASIIDSNTQLSVLEEKVINLEKEMEESKKDINSLKAATSNNSGHISEWVLHELKKYNIIIFGLEEISEDEVQIKLLLSDLDIAINESDIRCKFQVGKSNPEKRQPFVVRLKLRNPEQKRKSCFVQKI